MGFDGGEEEGFQIEYRGIDPSLNPSLDPAESIAAGFEWLELGEFGDWGTLSIAAVVTGVLKGLEVRLCGYSGLMLPVMEDVRLAEVRRETNSINQFMTIFIFIMGFYE